MKIGRKKLRMGSGEIRTFGSERKRDNFENVARAVKHGWNPKRPLTPRLRSGQAKGTARRRARV